MSASTLFQIPGLSRLFFFVLNIRKLREAGFSTSWQLKFTSDAHRWKLQLLFVRSHNRFSKRQKPFSHLSEQITQSFWAWTRGYLLANSNSNCLGWLSLKKRAAQLQLTAVPTFTNTSTHIYTCKNHPFLTCTCQEYQHGDLFFQVLWCQFTILVKSCWSWSLTLVIRCLLFIEVFIVLVCWQRSRLLHIKDHDEKWSWNLSQQPWSGWRWVF